MWIEEMVWLWLPIVGGVGIWMIWSIVTLKRDVRALRQRRAEGGAVEDLGARLRHRDPGAGSAGRDLQSDHSRAG